MKPNKGKHKVLSSNLFPVVGIGASAGGLEAFKKLIRAIPEKSGMAYIFVQHLDPKHESVLPDLLQRITSIPVHEISDNIHVEPDHIYIIPANKVLEATDGVLQLSSRPDPKKRSMPIDIFFSSLAEVHQAHAIGIVLSGTQTDGTMGLRAIKEHGGATFAQDGSSQYNGMPANAIAAGVVDFILPPEEIPQKLAQIADQQKGTVPGTGMQMDEDAYKKIISLLRIRRGNDFTYYKQSTVRRRILRRMVVTKAAEPSDYLEYLKKNKPELDVLYQDLLIPVTSFFRDPVVYDKLCNEVFPKILNGKPADGPIRIWVSGCSTGQEVYSMAICLQEYLGDKFSVAKVKIFASDISEPAIAKARMGSYKKTELQGMSPQRLQDNFSKTGSIYTINKLIREVCVFAVHNFLNDPPFPKMDLISCRNVLIYMEPHLQKRALTTFHYALNTDGMLLLGKSESISSVPELFTYNSKPEKMFYRKDVPGKFIINPNLQRGKNNALKVPPRKMENGGADDFQKMADDVLLSKYAPPGVIVDAAMDIVYFRGDTSAYLAQAPGKPSHNLLKMVRNELAFELRNLLQKAEKEGIPAIKENIPVQMAESRHYVTVEAIPLPDAAEPHYLFLFHHTATRADATGKPAKNRSAKTKAGDRDLLIQQLEQELALTREDMRSITEEQEAVNEELQSTNEELSSGSEELESLNEELQTSKEELQSTNEEIMIVNQEMISLNEQVSAARKYAETIITTIHEPLLVLDMSLRIKTANAAFYKIFRAHETDTEGALFFETGNGQWNFPELQTVLDHIKQKKAISSDLEVTGVFTHLGKRTMRLNVCQMLSEDGLDKFILLAIEDITDRTTLQQNKNELLSKFRNMVIQAPFAICIFSGPHYSIELANEKMLEFWGRAAGQVLNKPVFEAMPDLSGQGFEELLHQVYTTGKRFTTQEAPLNLLRNGKQEKVYIKLVYEAVYADDGSISGVMAVADEVTDMVMARKKIEESEAFNRVVLESSPDCVKILDKEGRLLYMNTNGLCLLEIDDFTLFKNTCWSDMWGEENGDMVREVVDKVLLGEIVQFQAFNPTVKGTPRCWDVIVSPVREEGSDNKVSRMIAVSRDITEQKKAALKLEESESRYSKMIHSSPSLIAIVKGTEMNITIANNAILEIWGKGKDVIGRPYFSVLPELLDQGYDEHLYEVYKTGIPFHANEMPVSILRYGNMELNYYNFTFQAQHNAAGEIEGVAMIGNEVTTQAAFNKKIKESEERFRSLADNAPMFVFIIEPNAEATISYWNKTWLDYTGQTFEEALGRTWDGIIHPGDVPGVMEIYIPAFEKREPYFLPAIRVKRSDSIYRWHSIKAHPRYLPAGEFAGFIGVGFDVHDQKVMQDTLKVSEERFRNLVEKALSPICILKGLAMVLEVANEPVFKIWQVGHEALGKPFLDIVPEMRGQPFMGLLLDVYQNGVTHLGNEQPAFFNREGGQTETIYFNFVYQPYREDDGTISGVMVFATDVTEGVVARKKMEAQATMVKDLLMTAPGFVCTLRGPEHIYELVNDQYQQLFGKRKIKGKPIMEALPELEGQGFDTLLHKVYTTGETYVGIDVPITLARDENLAPEVRYFNFSYQPVYDENRKINSILVFGYEVTEQVLAKNKNMEDEQLRTKELEEKVEQRTLQLKDLNAALHQKNEALETVNRELESFTYISSHDLQEPLRKIQTFAGRILEKEYAALSDAGKDYFNRMNAAARRMQTLIEDLLAYSHTNLAERKLETADLDQIVQEVRADLADSMLEKGATLDAGKLGNADINAFQFRQVVHNLFGNALKFSRPGVPPHLVVRSETKKGSEFRNEKLIADKAYLHISFSDNGIGFDPEYKDKIFEVFQRLHGKEEFAGTGIGLSIVKKIVENHNGSITATGEPGKGATFDIYLPVE